MRRLLLLFFLSLFSLGLDLLTGCASPPPAPGKAIAVKGGLPQLTLHPHFSGIALMNFDLRWKVADLHGGSSPLMQTAAMRIAANLKALVLEAQSDAPTTFHLIWDGEEMRVQSLDVAGKSVDSPPRTSTRAAAWFSPRQALSLFAWLYWDARPIQAVLPPGWRLNDEGMERTIYFQQEKVARIRYEANLRWAANVVLENYRENYRLSSEPTFSLSREQRF